MKWRFGFILAAALVLLGLQGASTSSAALAAVGPISPDHGYPLWYQDENGVALELCLDPVDACLLELPDPGSPVSFPDNFSDEAFWWAAEAAIEGGVGPAGTGRALLVLAMEAAFLNEVVADGDQMSFGRIRVRVTGDNPLVPGETYIATHPFGEETMVVADNGELRMSNDIGCEVAPCDFSAALGSGIGPFLTCVNPAPPAGTLGNPAGECQVDGSPTGNNLFRIEGPDIGGPGVDEIETDLFAVLGQITVINNPPTAVDDAAPVLTNSVDTIIDVLANDTDLEGDVLTVTDVTQGVNGAVDIDPLGANVTYTPDADFEGADSFTYTISDGEFTATATVNIMVSTDIVAPVITCPAGITVKTIGTAEVPNTHADIAAFLAGATAIDDIDPAPVITHNAPAMFPIAETMVTFTATDVNLNSAQCSASVTVTAVTLGDLNGDGVATIADALITAQCVAGLFGPCGPEGDVNSDGGVTIADALIIAQFVAGLIPTL